jgi:hypothetical protein
MGSELPSDCSRSLIISATLTTVDGVDLFWVTIELAEIRFSIGNPGSMETDEFDLFP